MKVFWPLGDLPPCPCGASPPLGGGVSPPGLATPFCSYKAVSQPPLQKWGS